MHISINAHAVQGFSLKQVRACLRLEPLSLKLNGSRCGLLYGLPYGLPSGRGTYMKIKSLGDAKILKLDPYFSKCYSKKMKKSFDFRT